MLSEILELVLQTLLMLSISIGIVIGLPCGWLRAVLEQIGALEEAANLIALVSTVVPFILSLILGSLYNVNVAEPLFMQSLLAPVAALVSAIVSYVCEEIVYGVTKVIMRTVSSIFESLTSYW